MEQKTILIVRGGGDLASGVIHRLIAVDIGYWCWNVTNQVQSAERFPSERLYLMAHQRRGSYGTSD